MSLSEIANTVNGRTRTDEIAKLLLEGLKDAFRQSGFDDLRKFARQSGYTVFDHEFRNGNGAASANYSITFSRNDLSFTVSSQVLEGQRPTFNFEHSKTPRVHGREREARTPINGPWELIL